MANPFDQFDKPAANPFDQFDAGPVAPVAEAVPDLSVAAEPEGRTAGEWLNDTALMLRRGARNVTGGLLGAPVDLANLAIDPLPARLIRGGFNALGADIEAPAEALGLPGAIEQPELVQGLRESIRRENLADTAATGSTTLAREQQGLAEADGFLGTVEYLARNPQALAMFGAEQVPQLVTAIPGRLLATIGLQGVSAGSQAEAQVAEALAAEVEAGRLSPEDAAQIQADVFRASGALNTALPFLPGAQTLERVAALRPLAGRGVVGGAVRGAAGEGTQGVLSEGGDQVIVNLATGRPIDEGVGQAAALGLLLEGPLGGLAGGAEGFAAGPVPPSADLGGVVPPQAPPPPVAPAGGVPAPIVPPAAAEALAAIGPQGAAAIVEALAPVRPAPVQVPEGATVESVRQQLGQATTDAERRQLAAILGALQEQGATSPQPGAETAQASGGETALPDLAGILNDPNIAAALDALAGEQTAPAPADAQAPAVGGSPAARAASVRATPEALDRALAMDEDAYIAAVNPEGKRSSAEDEIAFSANDIQAPADAVAVPEFGFTDRQGKPVTVLEAPDGTLYAQVEGKTVGLVESSNGETLNQVAKEFQGRGIGTGLIRAQLLRDPMTPAGSFSEAGERTRRAAFRQLRQERGIGEPAALGEVAQPTPAPAAVAAPEAADLGATVPAPARAAEPIAAPASAPATPAGSLPPILSQPRAKAIRERVKAAKLRPDSPGYAEAVANIEAQYEADVDAALAQTTFEQYRALNPGTPEGVARRAWEALTQQPLGQPGNVRRTMRPPPAEERAGPSWLEVDAETDALIDRARQEARRLAADTGEVAQRITRELGPNARRHITVVGQWADLPADVRRRAERAGMDERTEGFFDPRTGRVFILADERMTPERAVWVAFHETAGHLGLRAAMRRLAGDGPFMETLVREFDRAGRNVTVAQIARAIRRQNPDYGRLRSLEEALSELAAANRTGNWQEIQTRYGVEVPPSMRPGVRTLLDSILDAIRRFLNAVMGRDAGYTDGQVLRLLEDAWRDAQKAGQAARESDAMLSRRATSDGRGQRSIEWNGETWVNRDGEYYLADANGQPRDFFFVREAEAEAARTGGEVRRDEPVDGERQTYSVTLPEGVRMDAEREFVDEGPMFSRRANVDEVTGLPMNDDGTVTVYHHTSADRAEAIRRDGLLRSDAEPDVYVTTRAETDTGYGDTAVPIRVDPARLELDDEFPNGRRDFRINVGRPGGSIRVRVENGPTAPDSPGAPRVEASRDMFVPTRGDQTQTPEFRRWFGDSKVVDADGQPLVVYHGTTADFDSFDIEASTDGVAGWFTTSKEHADVHIRELQTDRQERERGRRYLAGGRILPVFATIKKPLQVDEGELKDRAVSEIVADAKRNGHDGLVIYRKREGDTVYVAFRPEQIKSATGNRGTFDPESDNILFSRRQGELLPAATEQEQRNAALSNAMANRAGLFGRLAAMGYPQGALTQQPGGEFRPVRKAVDEARRYLQDRMLPLRRAQEAAAGPSAPGVTTPTLEDGMNAYRLENLMHGAVADKMRDADERFILRIQRMMKNSGVSADQLQDYLLARHAPERNARIASINPAMPDGGSGITTQEAADIMAGTAPGPYSGKPLDADTRRKTAAIAAVVDEMRKETLAYMVKAGQITQQMADTLLERYPNYVPLRGWKGEDTEAGQRTGRGLQAVRNAIKRALGRRSLPDNLLGEMAGDLQRAIVAAEKAKVGRALLRFALAHPMPDLYTVEPVELEWKFSEATGEAYLGIRNSAEDIERSLVVKADDGTPVRIRFEDDALAQAIVNMNPVDAGGIVRTLGAVNRWRSAVLTRYNPAFAPVNMARDALFGVTAIAAEKGADVAAATVATYPQALRAMWRDARRARGRTGVPPAQRTWDDWARSFAALGGKTGLTRVDDVADLQRKMSEGTATLLELARQGKPWAVTREAVGRALKPVADVIEAGNDASENAIRLAVFRQLVLDGTSEQQAAEYAKNVTINFNRKGEWGPALNAIYLFYNATMQGTHAVFRVMRNPKVAGFLGALAVLQGVLAASMMGEDDDEDGITAWDKVPDYVKRTSLVIPLGWSTGNPDDYFALPMPYGFNIFTYAGGRGSQYMVLGERPTDTSITSDLFTATMDAFSPVPVTDGPRSVFGETIGFAMGLYGNKDDFGRPIVADRFAKDYVPRALLGRSDTPQIFHMLARASAKLGGGDLDKMIAPVGPLDIAPEQLEAVWNFATGGVGSILNRSIRAGEQMAAGNLEGPMEMVTATPIASRFVARGNTARAIAERYYREAEEMERNLAVLKERTRQQGVSDFDAILAEIQADEPAMAGVELDRYKRSGRWGEAGEPKLTDTGAPRLKAAPGSPMESYRLASRETEDLNRLIRQLRVGGQTQAELVRMVDENVAGDTTALEALNLSDYNPEAPATTAQRNRAIKLVQDFRAQQQQEFIRAMNRARQTGRER